MLFILSYTTPMSRNTSGHFPPSATSPGTRINLQKKKDFLTFFLVIAIKGLNLVEEDKPWEQRIYSL